MACLGILLLGAFNAVVVLLASTLAAVGDGRAGAADGVHTSWAIGLALVLLGTLVGLALCANGRRRLAFALTGGTLPLAWVALVAWAVLGAALGPFGRPAPELEAACRSAGVDWHARPAAPVGSLAFDYAGRCGRDINTITVGAGGAAQFAYRHPVWPAAIRFVEQRCEGPATPHRQGPAPITRRLAGGESVPVEALSADVRVRYRTTTQPVAGSPEGIVTAVTIELTDRRDERLLATLRYAYDRSGRRACGTTADGVIDEQAFVLQAIGQP